MSPAIPAPQVPPELWEGFDPATERVAWSFTRGVHRFTVPERVIALRTMTPTDEEVANGQTFKTRTELSLKYAAEGDIIDTEIDTWGWGVEETYDLRRIYNKAQVPDAIGQALIYTPPVPQQLPAS